MKQKTTSVVNQQINFSWNGTILFIHRSIKNSDAASVASNIFFSTCDDIVLLVGALHPWVFEKGLLPKKFKLVWKRNSAKVVRTQIHVYIQWNSVFYYTTLWKSCFQITICAKTWIISSNLRVFFLVWFYNSAEVDSFRRSLLKYVCLSHLVTKIPMEVFDKGDAKE